MSLFLSSVSVIGHENTSPTGFTRALHSQSGDFTSVIDLVIFEGGKLMLLVLSLDLLWGFVILLLSLLTTSQKSKDEMESRFFLNVVVREGSSVFELFSSEDQSLLIWRDAFLILNLLLDVINGVSGLDFLKKLGSHHNQPSRLWTYQSDSLPCQSLDKDLHGCPPRKGMRKGKPRLRKSIARLGSCDSSKPVQLFLRFRSVSQ